MKRLLPAPLLSASLFALWLVLDQYVDAGHLLLAAILAVALPLLAAPLRPQPARIRKPVAVARLVLAVGWDVLVSSVEVAAGVWRMGRRPPRSRFVHVPLDVRDTAGLAALSTITTVVPGTVWTELARDRSVLLLHVWDVPDEAAFVAHFKARYEQPLREIFE